MSEQVISKENNSINAVSGNDQTAYETIKKLNDTIKTQKAEIEDLKQQIAVLNKTLFGQRSEKMKIYEEATGLINMFNEAETEATTTVKTEEKKITIPEHTRAKKKSHEENFDKLESEEVIHKAENNICQKCGCEMIVIGKELIRREIIYIPAKVFVRNHFAEVLKCIECSKNDSSESSDIAKVQIKKGIYTEPSFLDSYCSPELLAHIIFDKYVQAVPLYRQEKEFQAMNFNLSRKTMANWIIKAVAQYAKPVWQAMKDELLKGNIIHADETIVQVLQEKDRSSKTQSRMWVYCTPSSAEKQNILFEYCQTRGGYNAENFLQGFKGHLICDGYDGYNKVVSEDVHRCGCWVHLRRKFIDALPTDEALVADSYAKKGVDFCNRIFALEHEYDGLDKNGKKVREAISAEERKKQRQERTKPVVDEFFAWLGTFESAGGSKLHKAKIYACNEREYLCRFLDNPYIEPDNNKAENAIRPFVVGRKNWLFSVSEHGAEASAILYSIAATAYANGLNIEQYFTELFKSKGQAELKMPWKKEEDKEEKKAHK